MNVHTGQVWVWVCVCVCVCVCIAIVMALYIDDTYLVFVHSEELLDWSIRTESQQKRQRERDKKIFKKRNGKVGGERKGRLMIKMGIGRWVIVFMMDSVVVNLILYARIFQSCEFLQAHN